MEKEDIIHDDNDCGGLLDFQFNTQSEDKIVHPHYRCRKCGEFRIVYTFIKKKSDKS